FSISAGGSSDGAPRRRQRRHRPAVHDAHARRPDRRSGLFKSFVDVLDNDLLIAKPVVLAATAGSGRHALVVDEQMRSLVAYMRGLPMRASVSAAPEDWGTAGLAERVRRAATELAVVVRGQIEQGIADRAWAGYHHEFAGNATRAEQTAADTDFDTPLMPLAAGGRANWEMPDKPPRTAG